MEDERSVKLEQGLKRKRTDEFVHNKKSRWDTLKNKNEKTSKSTTEEYSEINGPSEKIVQKSLSPIKWKHIIEGIREDDGSLREGTLSIPSHSGKHGSSSKYSKQESVPVEIPVNRADTGLHGENDSVERYFFANQRTTTCVKDRVTVANILETSDIKPEVHIEQLVEATTNNDNKDLEISGTSTQLDNDETEGKQDEYIYRILRFREGYTGGLRPKNISSEISIEKHVAEGSKGTKSKYISCCKTLEGVEELGEITNESKRVRRVVKINVTKIRKHSSDIEIIDLTDTKIRRKHIDPDSKAWGYAERFEEVILSPASHIPPEYVKYIGKIRHRTFTRIDDA
ncbi:uncharacterized protein LOC125662577 [Ostrea edulis]|uniref:uncharacterized protein LOC125662577 n=1 Tax=Ostrea edulis TaxID=37623 RepID=UPI0024AF973D|nr:uncharacterized protein LOC125662577 [Ostrea edulis]XP_056002880.1 uncharacterized protein LOC125662577 [Ostrea edulis]XP_056002881.1 uncharacterized protein LOC125662577 [Ostrea edulis]